MKQVGKKIFLSTIASSLIFSPLMALPSGGKFTHGTSGSIITNGNNMSITGKTENGNHVIQWGGGFNIGKGESVKFTTSGQNYLNIAYQKDASKIFGSLNGGTNNIYLINPMGVVIEKGGSVTANKFVASTTPLNDGQVNKFLLQGSKFSPVFDVNKKGNIINLGTINADNILLIGNKVEIGVGGKIRGQDGLKNAKEAHLVGNYVYVNVGKESDGNTIKVDKNSLKGTAIKEGYLQRDMTSFEADKYEFGNFGTIFKASYDGKNSVDFTKAVTIGGWYNDNNTLDHGKNANEWKLFADGWNDNELTEDIFKDGLTTIRLISDIDFTGFSLIDPVGANKYAFSGVFDGGGYTLKNIKIKAQDSSTGWNTGLFGKVEGKNGQKAKIYNLNVDGLSFSGTTNIGGGFVGQASYAEFDNIHLKNFELLEFTDNKYDDGGKLYAGGFVGWAKEGSSFKNITMDNIQGIILTPAGTSSKENNIYVGGFAGLVDGAYFDNILLNNFGKIHARAYETAAYIFAGGFAGFAKDNSSFNNITLNRIGFSKPINNHQNKNDYGYGIYAGYDFEKPVIGNNWNIAAAAGGFVGGLSGEGLFFENIVLNNIGDIEAILKEAHYQYPAHSGAGGFVGMIYNDIALNGVDKKIFDAKFNNIYLNFNDVMSIRADGGCVNGSFGQCIFYMPNYAGGFLGGVRGQNEGQQGGKFGNNFSMNNIYLQYRNDVTINVANQNGEWARGIFAGWLNESNFANIHNVNAYYEKRLPHQINNTGFYGDYWDYYRFFKSDRKFELYESSNRDKISSGIYNALKNSGLEYNDKGYYTYYSEKITTPDIPDLISPSIEKNDFDPAMLQYILDDIMNGHYTYNTKTGKWEIVGGNENNEIDQSVDFLNTFFANGAIGDEFFNLWKDDSLESYKKFKAAYEVYTNKETIKQKKEEEVKNAQGNFNDAYSAYQAALAALIRKINDYNKLNEQGITDNLQSTYDSILADIKALDQLYSNLMGSYDNLKSNVFVKNDIKEVGGYNGYNGSYEILGSVNLPIKGLLPTFNEPGKGGGGEDPTEPEVKPNIPKPDHNLVKIAYFEDEEKEEKEEAEIGEASADAGGIRCIVSDESKTMNVCITRKR
ncbi:filamentous hemagglutinin N-terminal domain-containing protein [Campylobacter sp. IFREMER_LSEM_CL2101]|uniref:filamentous hemagglutinin N-terminal domain-containing protein n=1 Tax=Campylobacter sp. IFREMER_LSEM_CL2101 TaxID=2911618 RepID=UPI0021E6DB1A|nr:filamentous hemagglutinin N-terminal domain-containing protein [Campylobacter sp. IFREMER_LSEM_CL2101]MCV3392327.1 filamentous hemagglutinin N-terminal domain-containing protein [Campylobacter sp. IFREMER_LSEM_CL2101]